MKHNIVRINKIVLNNFKNVKKGIVEMPASAEVHFHVIYGDITTEDAITANNAKSYVAKRIAAEMKKYACKV